MGYCSQAVHNVKGKHAGSWAVPGGGACCHGSGGSRRRDNVDSIARLKELDQGASKERDLWFASFTPLTQGIKVSR